jgi:hypothetical protein
MPKFLDTQAISHQLMTLIKDAKEKIILVSPYLKVNTQIQERLKTKSKIGTLGIEDLKVYEKDNLHAKCYLNEEKAIICSMNLYDYSQQNNIEMGILITKQEDKEAYEELIEEINNIKVNGVRKKFESFIPETAVNAQPKNAIPSSKKVEVKIEPLTSHQRLKCQLLKNWRYKKAKEEKCSAFVILTDEEIRNIAVRSKVDSSALFDILPKKKAIRINEEILSELSRSKYYTIGKVVKLWYQENQNAYDRVKLKIDATSEEKWFDTTQELPQLNSMVAVKINNT